MTNKEENRIVNFISYIESGKRFFKQLIEYFENEFVLNSNDIVEFSENVLKLKYLYKPYLLEVVYNEELEIGQFNVYESVFGTHFLTEPKFKLKTESLLFFDNIGNIFIGYSKVTHLVPSRAAEDIIKEIIK